LPKGPNGQERPADAIGCAVMVGQIATGIREESRTSGRKRSGLAGAKARNAALTAEKRSEIAKVAAEARWN